MSCLYFRWIQIKNEHALAVKTYGTINTYQHNVQRGSEALASAESCEAKETVKVLGLAPLFGKEGLGEILLQKHFIVISMSYCFAKSPSIPLFQRGRPKAEYFHSL